MPPNTNLPYKKPGNVWAIVSIVFIILTVGLITLSVWLFISYNDQKTDVDGKIAVAVSSAKKTQSDHDEAKFTAREKEPNREFVGPSDYGRVTFNYPKTWSVYVDKDAADGGSFEAYLNPISVPPVSSSQKFAIRVVIEQKDYNEAISSFDSLVEDGKLKASSVKTNDGNGTRLDGSFDDDTRGAIVLFKIRDKTLSIQTDANTFLGDLNKLISTITFKQ